METKEFLIGKEVGSSATSRIISNLKRLNPTGAGIGFWPLYEEVLFSLSWRVIPASIAKATNPSTNKEYGAGVDTGFIESVKTYIKESLPGEFETERRKFLQEKYGVKFKEDKPILPKEAVLCR